MRAVLLDGAASDDPRGVEIGQLLVELLTRTDWSPEHFRLRDLTINPCVGCFGCWTHTPGECRQNDDGMQVAKASAECDALVLLTRVRFGGYGALAKGALDRTLCNMLPQIHKVDGETRHGLRYDHEQSFLVIGLTDRPDPNGVAIFESLVRHNAANFGRSQVAARVLTAAWPDDLICQRMAEALSVVEAVV